MKVSHSRKTVSNNEKWICILTYTTTGQFTKIRTPRRRKNWVNELWKLATVNVALHVVLAQTPVWRPRLPNTFTFVWTLLAVLHLVANITRCLFERKESVYFGKWSNFNWQHLMYDSVVSSLHILCLITQDLFGCGLTAVTKKVVSGASSRSFSSKHNLTKLENWSNSFDCNCNPDLILFNCTCNLLKIIPDYI